MSLSDAGKIRELRGAVPLVLDDRRFIGSAERAKRLVEAVARDLDRIGMSYSAGLLAEMVLDREG